MDDGDGTPGSTASVRQRLRDTAGPDGAEAVLFLPGGGNADDVRAAAQAALTAAATRLGKTDDVRITRVSGFSQSANVIGDPDIIAETKATGLVVDTLPADLPDAYPRPVSDTAQAPPAAADTTDNRQACDLVLRGGVLSGVVYPGALVRLAERYRFQNVGGASVGAIGAGIAAAAEYGRQHGKPDAFGVVAAIPVFLGNADMRRLFRPHDALRGVFGLLWIVLTDKHGARRFGRLCLGLVRGWWFWALAVVGLAVLLAALFLGRSDLSTPMIGLTILLTLLGWATVLPAKAACAVQRLLRGHDFGLCPGVNPGLSRDASLDRLADEGAFADWMHATVQRAAGRSDGAPPLTVADLWGTTDPRALRKIDLMLTTTDLTHQLPARFPFLARTAVPLYFKPEELRTVLPSQVVDCMCAHVAAAVDGRYPLPEPAQLPIVLGMRLSLSFPGLISAVKLWTRVGDDWHPCWFTDGGLTSNFPVTAFDAALPRRPTFCINLADDSKIGADDDRVDLTDDEVNETAPRIAFDLSTAGVLGFLGALNDTARNAHENDLMTAPGHRGRIVTIRLDPKREGGFNIDMPDALIARLSGFGRTAADRLIGRFHPAGAEKGSGWIKHRWLRLRSMLASAETLLIEADQGWTKPQPDGTTLATVMARSKVAAPGCPWRDAAAFDLACAKAGAIFALAGNLVNTPEIDRSIGQTVFDGDLQYDGTQSFGGPKPAMTYVMRIRPRGVLQAEFRTPAASPDGAS